MYTLTIIQNYIQNLLVFLAKIGLISSNLRQRLGKIDNTAVHRICCSMTNTYDTYLGHITVIDINYNNICTFFIFRQPQFLMGVELNISISTYQVAPGGINNHNFPIAYTL